MFLLAMGVLLWALVHFLPVFFPSIRALIIGKIGAGPYKGLFSLSIIATIAMMVTGYQAYSEEYLYPPFVTDKWIVAAFVWFAFVLFTASTMKSNLKQYWRNPQMSGLIVWSIAHLVISGEARSVILFGGLLVWAIAMIVGTNRRDGDWVKPPKTRYIQDIKVLVTASIAFVIVLFTHVYFTGIALV